MVRSDWISTEWVIPSYSDQSSISCAPSLIRRNIYNEMLTSRVRKDPYQTGSFIMVHVRVNIFSSFDLIYDSYCFYLSGSHGCSLNHIHSHSLSPLYHQCTWNLDSIPALQVTPQLQRVSSIVRSKVLAKSWLEWLKGKRQSALFNNIGDLLLIPSYPGGIYDRWSTPCRWGNNLDGWSISS